MAEIVLLSVGGIGTNELMRRTGKSETCVWRWQERFIRGSYAFLQSRRLKAAGRKKRVGGPPPQPSMPAIRQAILDLFARPPPLRCPHCKMLIKEIAKSKVPK